MTECNALIKTCFTKENAIMHASLPTTHQLDGDVRSSVSGCDFILGIPPQHNTCKISIIRFVIKQALEFELGFCFETQASFYLYAPAGGLLEKGQNKPNMGD